MYSRSRAVSAEEQYASNIPPVYGGSRFYRTADAGVQAEVCVEKPPVQADGEMLFDGETQADPPCCSDEVPALCDCVADTHLEPAPPVESCACKTEAPRPESAAEHHAKFPSLSLFDVGAEEILLIVVLLLLCGEQERPGDMIAVLLLLIVMR